MEVRRAPMPDGGFITTYADITDRKQRMRFEAANEAKSQFLQNMSHDLRKPIAAIIEDARLTLADHDQTLPADVRTAYANIDVNSGHLLAMIDELLEMSRIEAGQVTVRPRHFTLQIVLDEVLRVIEPPARAKGLDVKIDCDGSVQVHQAMRRFTRLTNGFSKKVENHAYAVALHMMYYYFVRLHSKLRMSPAMAAGVSERLWEISDIVALVEVEEAKSDRTRGPYRKRAQ